MADHHRRIPTTAGPQEASPTLIVNSNRAGELQTALLNVAVLWPWPVPACWPAETVRIRCQVLGWIESRGLGHNRIK